MTQPWHLAIHGQYRQYVPALWLPPLTVRSTNPNSGITSLPKTYIRIYIHTFKRKSFCEIIISLQYKSIVKFVLLIYYFCIEENLQTSSLLNGPVTDCCPTVEGSTTLADTLMKILMQLQCDTQAISLKKLSNNLPFLPTLAVEALALRRKDDTGAFRNRLKRLSTSLYKSLQEICDGRT